jgi:hypothetical protein
MSSDVGKRGSSGVVCCLVDLGDGDTRVILDDVSNAQASTQGSWKHEVLFTWKDLSSKDISEQTLSEKELADFGASIFARLTALQKHPYG